jgi:hypothetical protein
MNTWLPEEVSARLWAGDGEPIVLAPAAAGWRGRLGRAATRLVDAAARLGQRLPPDRELDALGWRNYRIWRF